jgi:uncharacterized membrane protein YkvA (DUF1232 family)
MRDTVAPYLATRDPRVRWYAKALAVVIAAYALSPIDLIPDFIPLGYLDELILLPLAIAGVVRLIDPAIMAEHRATAATMAEQLTSKSGAALTFFHSVLLMSWRLQAIGCASVRFNRLPRT